MARTTTMRLTADDLASWLGGIETHGVSDEGDLTPEGKERARRIFKALRRLGVSAPSYEWMRRIAEAS